MTDLPQGADLAAHRLMPGGGVEELERSLLALDVVPHPVHLRKPALPEHLDDHEAVVEDVPGSVVSVLGHVPEAHDLLVGFRERLGSSGERAGAARLYGASGIARHVLD